MKTLELETGELRRLLRGRVHDYAQKAFLCHRCVTNAASGTRRFNKNKQNEALSLLLTDTKRIFKRQECKHSELIILELTPSSSTMSHCDFFGREGILVSCLAFLAVRVDRSEQRRDFFQWHTLRLSHARCDEDAV